MLEFQTQEAAYICIAEIQIKKTLIVEVDFEKLNNYSTPKC